MYRFFVLFYFLICTAPAMAIEAVQSAPSLSGVVEDETSQPVTGVEVTLFIGPRAQRTSTNDLGRFHFEAVPPGDYHLNFEKAGFFRLSEYAVTVTSEWPEITVTLNHEYE